MLRALSVRDFVIVERTELELGPGFTVLTGETGAGKSILVDALELLVGGRGDASLVRDIAWIDNGPGWVGVDLGREGYAVVKVNRVIPRTAQSDRARERTQLTQSLAGAESIAFYNHLKERFKAEIKVAKPADPAL